MLTIKGSGIPGQYRTKILYLKLRKKLIELRNYESDDKAIKLLKEEAYRLEYCSKNGMLSKGLTCSVLLNIVTIVDAYGNMYTPVLLESLNVIAMFLKILQQFKRDLLKEEAVQEIILEDIIAHYTINTDFKSLKDNAGSSEEMVYRINAISHLIYFITLLLNFNKDTEFRATTYGYLIQILEHNNGAFKLEPLFVTEAGIKHVSKLISACLTRAL